ncbi:hypothetical protein G9A89_022956 [Geosiphon pyriformis]|nr:hypothetical protein G9A89_022956 [Geosiphon pyriformis]
MSFPSLSETPKEVRLSEIEKSHPVSIASIKSFKQLGLNSWLIDALKGISIKFPTEIQTACIPPILAGRDCIGGAKTGSGKTAAFALPILQKLAEDPYGVFALVLTPTRELAFQIAEQFRVLGKGISLKECTIVGGLDMMTQAIELSRRPHVVIATPGRLVDHLKSSSNAVNLRKIRFLVLDEADRLLSSTFAENLAVIFDHIPKQRQTLLFTATMTENIIALQSAQKDPSHQPFLYEIKSDMRTVSTLAQYYVFIPSHIREPYLMNLLRSDQLSGKSTIIFCGRCRTAEMLRIMLFELNIRCTSLHSTMSQQERLNSLGKFRAEVVKVLIATDVGSRGLDIPTVQVVVNFDIPRDPTDYIHRVGRTARAGRGGIALSIVTERDVELIENIETRINKKMEEWPVKENKVLESLNEIATAKRVATMHLHDNKFGATKELQKKKRAILVNGDIFEKTETLLINTANMESPLKDRPDLTFENHQREQQFCIFFRGLPQKPENSIRLFERSSGDYYSVHGDDALFIAQNLYKTSSVIKYLGGDVGSGVPSCTLNRLVAETFLRDALLNKQMKVEMWGMEPRKTGWKVIKRASPGNLQEFEDLLFTNVDMSVSPIAMTVNLGKQNTVGVAFADTTIGELGVAEFPDNNLYSNFEALVIQLGVKECGVRTSETDYDLSRLKAVLDRCGIVITELKNADFSTKDIEQDLNRLLADGTSVANLPEFELKVAMGACASLIKYLELLTDMSNFGNYTMRLHDLSQYMKLDTSAVRALNLMPSPQDGSNKTMSLLGLLNRCKTAQGERLLCQWLKQPLMELKEIEQRQTLVETFFNDATLRQSLRNEGLKNIPDLYRLAKRLKKGFPVASLQEVVRVYQVVTRLPVILNILENNRSVNEEHQELLEKIYIEKLKGFTEQLDPLREMVETTIDLEALDNHKYLIKPDVDEELQEIRTKMNQTMDEMNEEHRELGEKLNLDTQKKLHLEKHHVYGYCFRITRNDSACIRGNKSYIELVTLKTGVYFTTSTIQKLTRNFEDLSEEYSKKQRSLVKEVITIAATHCPTLETLNALLANLDVLLSFAEVSAHAPKAYTRPKMFAKGEGYISLKEARHPCLEVQSDVSFIPNDVELIRDQSEFLIITGPNMGGKSTYIRQIGVITLMAQTGCFVPCSDATISIIDCIHARVGAGDSQLKGISTFMAEMLETASILNTATPYSLIIIDELGRGTSTYDGFGLAWSISEHIAKQMRCYCLFATHFHELTALAEELPYVRNFHVTADIGLNSDGGRDITLLYRVNEGVCDESFGIHVAELANFPATVVKLAQRKANQLENYSKHDTDSMEIDGKTQPKNFSQLEIDLGSAIVADFLREVSEAVVDIDSMDYDSLLFMLNEIKGKYNARFEKNRIEAKKLDQDKESMKRTAEIGTIHKDTKNRSCYCPLDKVHGAFTIV